MEQIVEGKILPPSELRRDVPPALDDIAMRALEREPSLRFQSAAAMGSALDRLADAEGWGCGRTTLRRLMNRLFEHSGPNDPVVARTGDHDEPPTTTARGEVIDEDVTRPLVHELGRRLGPADDSTRHPRPTLPSRACGPRLHEPTVNPAP